MHAAAEKSARRGSSFHNVLLHVTTAARGNLRWCEFESEVVLFKARASQQLPGLFFSYSHLLQARRPEAPEVNLSLHKDQNRTQQQASRWKQACTIQSHTPLKSAAENQANILQPESACSDIFFTSGVEEGQGRKSY